nr:alkyl sulfatase dimerization domain-containing protein [Candidatus Sigynarchaeota archaeon]
MSSDDLGQFFGMFPPASFANGKCHLIGAFANVGMIETSDGLVLFDASHEKFGEKVFNEIRAISKKPVKHLVLSHGHFDHCFGFDPFIKEIEEKHWDPPEIIAHWNVPARFEKYRMLDKYHEWINAMQFSAVIFNPKSTVVSAKNAPKPTRLIRDGEPYSFSSGEFTFVLHPGWGETDDHLWMHVPEAKAIFAGDFFLSSFPNLGNPFKVQRYPKHWAIVLRQMMEKEPEFLIPGHGKLIAGTRAVQEALSITADALDFVHDGVVKRLNEGKWFETIYHEVLAEYPERFKKSPWLRPIYGCVEYAIHCTYRLYHGWYDSGNPTDLYPSRSEEVSREIVALLGDGGAEKLLSRAMALAEEGNFQLAMHLVDQLIYGLDQDDAKNNDVRERAIDLKIRVVRKRAVNEPSMISRNIYANYVKNLTSSLRNGKK